MEDNTTTEADQARLRSLFAFNKVAWIIVKKWWFVLLLVFCALSTALGVYLSKRAQKSVNRYEATTRLMFTPKKISRIENMGNRQLMSILERGSIKREVASHVKMDEEERMCVGLALKVEQDKRQSNLFTLTATSKSRQGAADKVNIYAELLAEEYVKFRSADFDDWKKNIESRRDNVAREIAKLDVAESELTTRIGVLSPKEALLALNSLISDQRRNLSALGVDLANEELKKKKLEAAIGNNGKSVMDNAQAIRRRVDAITAVDDELTKLREKFTDTNPKVSGKIKERADLVKELEDFLKSKGAEGVDIEKMDHLEKTAGALADCATRMEAIDERKLTLEQEIKANEKDASKLVADVIEYDKIESRRKDLKASLRDLEEQLDNIAYASVALRNDLRQIERASGAEDHGSFGIKEAVFSLGGAGACTFALMLVILASGLMFGYVRGGKEISVYSEINFLGSLPKCKAMSEEEERDVMVVVAQKALSAGRDAKIVLECRLPGVKINPKFTEVMDFTASMSGVRCFIVDIVSQEGFTPHDGCQEMLGVVRNGQHGWFPMASKYSLAPTEIEMLKADLATLNEEYDNIFIRLKEHVRVGGAFFDQILQLCGAVLLGVGDRTTTRRVFAYARRHMKASGKTIMAIATGAKAKVVREEMEVLK